jgi:hypothetical protein
MTNVSQKKRSIIDRPLLSLLFQFLFAAFVATTAWMLVIGFLGESSSNSKWLPFWAGVLAFVHAMLSQRKPPALISLAPVSILLAASLFNFSKEVEAASLSTSIGLLLALLGCYVVGPSNEWKGGAGSVLAFSLMAIVAFLLTWGSQGDASGIFGVLYAVPFGLLHVVQTRSIGKAWHRILAACLLIGAVPYIHAWFFADADVFARSLFLIPLVYASTVYGVLVLLGSIRGPKL